MPNPAEVATVVANGMTYQGWTEIQIERRYDDVISHMRLTVAEQSSGSATGGANPELMPGDMAQGYLAGILVISGIVCLRQVQYDKGSHTVLIVVASITQNLATSTVDGQPGYYQGYTFSQIANAVAGKVGVTVQVQGGGAGAEKPFPRVSEHIGETRFAFIARLAAQRNLFLVDDSKGTLLATQGTGGTAAQLVEGQNIESALLTLRNDEYANPVRSVGANFAGSQTTTDDEAARDVSAVVSAPNKPTNVPATVAMPQPGDNQDAAMYAARVAAWYLAQYIDGKIAVPGWFLDNGDLWINHVGSLVSISSPMLVPGGQLTLAIKGVIHRQDNQNGTQTIIEVCDPGSLGSLGEARSGAGAGGDTFAPQLGGAVPGQ